MSSRPLYKVFEQRARGIGHILRDRGIYRMVGFRADEAMHDYQFNNDDGSVTLAFVRESDGRARIEFQNVKPSGLSEVNFGEETVLKSEFLGSNEEIVDNRSGTGDIEVSFRDLFAKSDEKSKETSKSAGTSVSVTVSASESIEGVADFEESVTAEAHAEYSESESSTTSTSKEEEGEESTTVPVGEAGPDHREPVPRRHAAGGDGPGRLHFRDRVREALRRQVPRAPRQDGDREVGLVVRLLRCRARTGSRQHLPRGELQAPAPLARGPVGAESAQLRGEIQREVRGPRHADLQSGRSSDD